MVLTGPAGSSKPHTACKSAAAGWPRRRHYLLLALVFCGIAVYGSLVPLRFAPLGLREAARQMKEILSGPISVRSRSDWAANVLLFVPIGYLLLAVLTMGRRSRGWYAICIPLVALLCAALGVLLEFGQLWLPDRSSSLNDVVAQSIGTAVGMTLWLTAGRTLTKWVRGYALGAPPRGRVDWLLRAYLVGLVIYSVRPLDLVSSPRELVHKYREGYILLTPFSDPGWGPATIYALLRDTLIFIPVGMLAATWLRTLGQGARPLGRSVMLGGAVVLGIEAVQLVVYSRPTAASDPINEMVGVCLGAWVMRVWRRRRGESQPSSRASPALRRTWLWLGLAAAYSVLLVAVFCTPFEPIDDRALIKERYHGFLAIPFASYFGGSWLRLILDVLKKGLLFGMLGGLLAMALTRLSVPRPVRRILLGVALLAAGGVATLIELLQVFLAAHTPSSSDVILYTVAAAVGMFVTLRVVDAGRTRT